MTDIKIEEIKEKLESFVKNKLTPSDEIHLIWIGQAGFIIKYGHKLLIIDPYLSDFLSKKYKDKIFPHIRLMNPPILPNQLENVNVILSTHAHSDHMDPETLSMISEKNPHCIFIIPNADKEEAIKRGVNANSIQVIDAYQEIEIIDDIHIKAIPSAHETLKMNPEGKHHFLGYIFKLGTIRIYHSGDCIPYKGLPDILKENNIDIALLPINGRDDYRLKNKIAGNFHISEAIDLCKEANISHLIVHHFGMFAYNTVSTEKLEELKEFTSKSLKIIIPEINKLYILR